MTRKSEERSLQITSKIWFEWSLPDVLAFHPANEAYFGDDRERAIIQMSLLKKQGFMAGVADWLLFWGEERKHGDVPYITPKHGAIELKTDSGRLSDKQVEFKDKWIKTGGLYAVCKSMDEIEATVISWGLKPKYRTPLANAESHRQMRQFAVFEAFRPLEEVTPRICTTI